VCSETVEMAGSHKSLIYVFLIAVTVSTLVMGERPKRSTLVMGEHPERRSERSVAGQYSSTEMDAELGSELQWLREKTAQVSTRVSDLIELTFETSF